MHSRAGSVLLRVVPNLLRCCVHHSYGDPSPMPNLVAFFDNDEMGACHDHALDSYSHSHKSRDDEENG